MTLSEIYRAIEDHLNDTAVGMPWEDELMEVLKHMDNAVGMEFRFDPAEHLEGLRTQSKIDAHKFREAL